MVSLRPALLCVLAACQGEGGGGGAPEGLTFGVGLATRDLTGAQDLWLFRVRESEQGGVDRNGDGDALDELVFVLDLRRGAGPRAVIEPGLALGEGDRPGWLACDGQAAAIAVDEAAQNGTDLNADGDAEDRVLFVFDRARGVFTNQGLAVSSIEVGGPLVACAVDEKGQGGADLDGDGDATDSVLAVYDTRDGSTRQLGLRDSAPLLVRDEFVALRLAERNGLDLNLDGDDQDRMVFEVYDGRTRLLQNTTLVLASSAVSYAGGAFGVSVSEADQGQGDLSGDGDEDDSAFYVYDPRRAFSINLGVTVPLAPAPPTDERRFLLHVREEPGALDANLDGDLDDLVVQVFDALEGILVNTGLASQGAAVLAGEWVGVSVSEPMQGSLDLNGDGELGGDIVHVHELRTGTQQNLGLDAFVLHGSLQRVFLAPFESAAQVDWNLDGDRLDRVLFDWSSDDRLLRQGSAVSSVLDVQGDTALVTVHESGDGEDRNGDGDADDLVLELHDGSTGRIRSLGLAAGSAAHLTVELDVLALVEEEAQGRDLNGDGDRADEVLHVVLH